MKLEFYKNTHLVIASLGSLFLLGLEFPYWFLSMISVVFIWRYFGEKKVILLPSAWITNSLALILFVAVLAGYKTLFDRDSSSLFFSCLCALKILEYKNRRDHLFIVLLLMLLISSKFLFSIDIWILPVTLWLIYHLWLSLISCHSEKSTLPSASKIYFLKIALLSLPLTIALYFMFPRLNSYLLNSNLSSRGSAVTGFGNEIRPGSISQLAQSQELIFRAEIIKSVYIDRQQLYWRGLVLRSTDGFRWYQGPPAKDITLVQNSPEFVDYKMTVEPNQQKWLFPLDRPLQMTSSLPLLRTRDGLYQTSVSIDHRTSFRAQSNLSLTLRPEDEKNYLKIPIQSPRILKLIEALKGKSLAREKIVQNIKNYFVDQNFLYTLSAGEMNEHSLDDFLFKAKKGYCEHFSSSFAILARAAGVPARVVIGYQGGEFNSIGNFYTVRAQDAHAWNEYVNDRGDWVPIDLVDVVAPVRTALGTAEFLKLPENLRGLIMKRNSSDESFLFVAYDYLSTYMDSLNFYWTQWLLDFNLDRQSELFESLPAASPVFLILFIIFIFIGFKIRFYWTHRNNWPQYFYKQLLNWANKRHLAKKPSEGPSNFVQRLQEKWPANSDDFGVIVQNYVNFTFADIPLSLRDLKNIRESLRRIESITNSDTYQ